MTDPLLETYGECTPQHILHNPMMRKNILNYLDMLEDLFIRQFSQYNNVQLNLELLKETVESCFCDIYRLKLFRGIHHEDKHKQAAFFMIWIAKIRPIQVIAGTNVTYRSELFANEIFAVWAGLTLLNVQPRLVYTSIPEYFTNLLYLLHFHSCSAEQLASEMFLLEKLIAGLAHKNNSVDDSV
jgi:hypothetical protein